eukprot:TRINITY_DN13362_c0_g1_i1.p1 TRINITY_DN13362_c0_g1~~TRINITY_DN13362_c0_g1_i1.p1  ORF type:complete len:363 (-),score=86.98 TRINITY_DN13362_c0_g1_i1:19-1071(-)
MALRAISRLSGALRNFSASKTAFSDARKLANPTATGEQENQSSSTNALLLGAAGAGVAGLSTVSLWADEQGSGPSINPPNAKALQFDLDSAAAQRQLDKQLKGAFVAPSQKLKTACEQSLTAVYVPAWQIEVTTEVSYRGSVSVQKEKEMAYRASKGTFAIEPQTVLVCAASGDKQSDVPVAITAETADAVAPWSLTASSTGSATTSSAVITTTQQQKTLSFGLSPQQAWEQTGRAVLRQNLEQRAYRTLAQQSSTGEVMDFSADVEFGIPRFTPVLLPMYVAVYEEQNGKRHVFVINGQSGKTDGKLPLSIPTILLTGAMTAATTLFVGYSVLVPPEAEGVEIDFGGTN